MAHKLLLLTQENDRYREFLSNSTLPKLILVDDEPHNIKEADIWLAEPSLAAPLLGHANHLKWLQSTSSSVDALMRPRLRQDYVLTNINGALSPIIAEYIFSDLLIHQPELPLNLSAVDQPLIQTSTEASGALDLSPPANNPSTETITSDTQAKLQVNTDQMDTDINYQPDDLANHAHSESQAPSKAQGKIARLEAMPPELLQEQTSHIWQPRSFYRLQNQHLLLLGTGVMSRYIAKIAKQFGMLVSGVNRTGVNIVGFDRVGSMRHLTDFIAQADVVINSYPTTRQSEGLITEQLLLLLKPKVTFFNFSTLAVFEQDALIVQFQRNPEQRLILNLIEKETLPAQHPFYCLTNVELAPFLPMQTSSEQAMEVFFYNYRRYLMGQSLSHQVYFKP